MNRLMCFLTGGHRYASKNITSHPICNNGFITLSNYCIKCGKIHYYEMNLKALIQKALEEKKGGAE